MAPVACFGINDDAFINLMFSTIAPLGCCAVLFLVHTYYNYFAKVDAKTREDMGGSIFGIFLLFTFLVLPTCSSKIFLTFLW